MKNNFEKQMKESLDNLDFQYDPKAWKGMKKKLDVVKPVSKLPIYLGIGGAASLIIAAFVVFNSANDNKVNETKISSNTNSELTEQPSTTITDNGSTATSGNNSSTNAATSDHSSVQNVNEPITNETNVSERGSSTNTNSSDNQRTNPVNTIDRSNPTQNEVSNTIQFKMPAIPTDLCEGASVLIENKNSMAMFIASPNGNETTISANAKLNFTANAEGIFEIGYYDRGNAVTKGTLNVLESPKASISTISQNEKYDERGLPVTTLYCTELGSSYNWNVEGVKLSGKEVNVHLFKKGTHTAELTVVGANGCKTSTSKRITVDEKYNLMAVNSFVPSDADPANNTFMPYSLKLRNTSFSLIIIDPKDGHVVFETSDASQGWDGTDRQNGQLVPYETAYIWKVVIENPEKNESPEYAGTIIPLANRR